MLPGIWKETDLFHSHLWSAWHYPAGQEYPLLTQKDPLLTHMLSCSFKLCSTQAYSLQITTECNPAWPNYPTKPLQIFLKLNWNLLYCNKGPLLLPTPEGYKLSPLLPLKPPFAVLKAYPSIAFSWPEELVCRTYSFKSRLLDYQSFLVLSCEYPIWGWSKTKSRITTLTFREQTLGCSGILLLPWKNPMG